MRYIFIIFFLIVFSSLQIKAQHRDLIQFSGLVVTGDSLKPVSFTSIIKKGTSRGTISDYFGFFSLVASKGDTIVFSSVGFKKSYYIIPDTLTTKHYTMFHVLQPDTVYLSETVVYPWPSPSQFKNAFLSLNIPDDDYERALKNIALMAAKNYMRVSMDGSMNYKNYIQKQIQNYYTLGQMPVNNLLNPLAWAAFFKAWQDGDFKKKRETDVYPPD